MPLHACYNVDMQTYMDVCMPVHTCPCMNICICMDMCVYIGACAYIFMLDMYTYMHGYMHACACIFMCESMPVHGRACVHVSV